MRVMTESIARSQLRRSTSTKVGGRTKPKVSADYVVGLTDGEGCFYVNISSSIRYRVGAKVELHFHIKLNERDRMVLEKIKNTLKCGNVYFQKEKRMNHTQCYRYTVASHRDILGKIIPFFLKHPLQTDSKRANFELFCQIAQKVSAGEHLTEKGITEMRALKARMNLKTFGLA
jgi:hypothetical protein